jgi:HK97 family phage prohead protease
MKKTYRFASIKAVNAESRTVDAVASSPALDRDNEIVLPSAFVDTLTSFKANPVILACHQHRLSNGSSPVIGSAAPESIVITDDALKFTLRFAATPLGDEYWTLYRDGHMRAFSIGFMPKAWEDRKDEKLGFIRTFTKVELYEISAVPVPANPDALVEMAASKTADDDTDSRIATLEAGFEKLKDLVSGREEFAESLLGDETADTSNAQTQRLLTAIMNATKGV